MYAGPKEFYNPACPYLGTVHDSAVRCGYATRENVCYAQSQKQGVDLAFQESHCLRPDYVSCTRYQEAAGAAAPMDVPVAAPYAEPEIEPQPASFPLRTVMMGAVAVLAVVLIVLLVGRVRGVPATNTPPAQPAAASVEPAGQGVAGAIVSATTAAPGLTPTPLPTATPAPTSTATPTPAPTDTATPTPTVTASPTPSPSPTKEAAVLPTAVPAPTSSPYLIVRTGPLNARIGPGPDYRVVYVVYGGDRLTVSGRTAGGDWVQACCVLEQTIWLATEFVTVSVPITTLEVLPLPPVPYPPPAP